MLVMVGVSEVLGSRSTFTIFPAVRRTRSLLNTFPFNQVAAEGGRRGGAAGGAIKIRIVERLYCKRPILCLASSKILTPPHTVKKSLSIFPSPGWMSLTKLSMAGRVWSVTPHLGTGKSITLFYGAPPWEVNILKDARYSSVLYICKYFVVRIK